MDWLREHLGYAFLGGLLLLGVVLKWGGRAWQGVQLYLSVQQRIGEGQSTLIHVTENERDSYKRRCEEKDREIEALQLELVNVTRQFDTRGDINAQDRLVIRLLKERLAEHRIEFDDIEPTVKNKVRQNLKL